MKTIYKKLLFLFLLLPFGALAQSTLSGIVVDSKSSQPLPGVNVIVQGAQNSTTTDFDGKFQLGGLKSGDKLVFSFIGYDSQTVNFSGQNSVNVSLEESANQLQEVVVQVGYGTVKKKDATGSVTTLGTKDFNKGSNVTAENLLTGRVAGLTINAGGGAPGSGTQIRIRGGSSLFASNDPLIVIDGLPLDSQTTTGATSFLASLNPNDIESFTVLKDASATAIYGSRASNGVIIITTKKGGKKLSVEYNFQYGSGKQYNKVDVFGADEYRALIQQQLPGRVGDLGTANTDWQEEIYRRTDFVDNNISVRGNLFGTIPARLSVGNTYQEGLRLTNEFNRNTVSTSLNPSFFKDHLKIRLSANYSNENSRFADGVEGDAIRFDPTQPVYDAASPYGGYFEYLNPNGSLAGGPRNPVSRLLQTFDTGVNNRFFGNFEVDYKFHFFPALRAVINVGFDESNGERDKVMSSSAGFAPSLNDVPYGKREHEEGMKRNKLFDAYLVYTKTFGKLDFELQGGYSYQIRQSWNSFTGNPLDPNYNVALNSDTVTDTDNVLLGYFGRTKFSYNDTYLLTVTMRRDGSSRFPVNNRYGNFPSAAFAWKLKNVAFKDSKTISDLKLRLGYGITGQQEITAVEARNVYLQQYSIGGGQSQYIFGTINTPIAISAAYNPDLKWEETTTYNVGLDYGLFNDRVTGSLDAYYKKTEDLIVQAAVPDGGNFSNVVYQNIGSFTTKGIELSVNADVVKGNDFTWNVNFNATKFERRIDELAFDSNIYFGGTGAGTGGTALVHSEGFTPGSFFMYKQLYNNAGQPIEGAYADLNGDGIINTNDRYLYKNSDPDAVFGFASTMNYKNFDFSFNMRASVGNRIFNAVNAGRAQYDNLQDLTALINIPTAVLDTNFNTTADVVLSDLYIENGSYLKLDNITVGYTFPKWLDGKASLRLYAGAQNVLTITDYSGLDPEINNDGIDNTIYPRQRQFLFGANVKF
jgi:TonB-linked SusC/RagA family outer membrane protein